MGNQESVAPRDPSQPVPSDLPESPEMIPGNESFKLSILFDSTELHDALRLDTTEKVERFSKIISHKSSLQDWLRELTTRGEDWVSKEDFIDKLTQAGIPLEPSLQFFSHLDEYASNRLHVPHIREELESEVLHDDVSTAVKRLSACVMLPSVLDVFLQGDALVTSQTQQACMLSTYVKNCSAPLKTLTSQELSLFFFLSKSRHVLLKNHFEKFGKKAFEPDKTDESLTTFEGYQKVSKPFTNVQVSSNSSKQEMLFDSGCNTYWQSSGNQGAHYIRFYMLPLVLVEQLTITVSGSDASYMPRVVEVVAGHSEYSLQRIALCNITKKGSGNQVEVLLNCSSTYHKIIQINIKECYQDGCDTRVRCLTVVGYRSDSMQSMSEQEATYSWLLCLLTATASLSIGSNPAFRRGLVSQGQRYLQHISPLSFSSSSTRRPIFMNKEFVEQLHAFFLQLLDYLPSDPIPLDTQAFSLLLHFSLAHGYMHLLIPLMHKYVDAVVGSGDEDTLGIPCVPLFRKIDQTLIDLEMENASPLTLRIEEAEGFAKPREELSGLLHHEMVNPDSSESTAYASKEDGTALDLVLTDMKGRHFNLRKLGIAKKGDNNVAPHLCLLFCVSSQHLDPHTHRPTDSKKLIELYSKFNSWTMDDWKKSEQQKPRDPDQPVACYDLTADDWSGSCTVETCTLPCYCCVIKLLKPKKEPGAEDGEQKKTFSVYAIQLHGEISPSIELQMMHSALAKFHTLPSHDSAAVESSTVILRLFAALITLVRNQTAVINRNSDWNQGKKLFLTCFVNVPHLNLDSLSFLDVWKLFLSMEKFANTFTKHRTLTLEIVTHFLLICMPYFNTFNRQNKPKEEEGEFKAEVLDHISRILNDPSVSDDVISSLSGVLEAGVTILFPKQEVRIQRLLEGVKLSTSTEDHPRAEIKIVSALIHYFSTQEVNKLLELPSPYKLDFEKEIDINVESILEIMTPLFSILHQRTLQQVDAFVSQADVRIPRINIVPLLSSLQNVILNWSYALALTDKATEHSRTSAKVLLCRYLNLIERELSQLLRLLTQHIKVEKILSAFEHGLISVLLPELVCALHVFNPVQGVRDFVLHMFQGFVHKFTELSHAIPNFRTVYRQPQQDPECLLGKWERESPHFTYNRKEENDTFSTPGAAYFLIEFDNRSKTESGYEQLEFTDKDGKKYKYAGRVGSNSWPFSVYIKGDILTFRYKTDGGEFGYKMSVSAYGAAISLHWFRDLYLSLAALFGRFCGENLKLAQGSGGKSSLTEEEVILLKSDIGKSIFRGGLQRSRFVRSFSGMHQTNSASDGLITQFLNQMISEDASAKALDFLQVCQTTFKQPRYGGYLADKAVRATFAALLWHSQELRDEIIRFESKKETGKISSRTTATYRLAESVRPGLLAAKQVLIQKKEDSPDKTIDPDQPLIDCIDKALFLLKFAGLSRSDGEADKTSPKRGKLHRKKSKVGIAQVVEKDPYMDIILNFVRSDSYSIARIQEDMEERAKSAQNRSLTYNFTRDFVLFATQTTPEAEPHQILSVFLTACFSEFKATPPHYGGNLDGCGLELETRVRESFYNLSQKLFQSVWNEGDLFDISKLPPNATFLLSILHLLLNNIWNDFDFNFLLEHKLPSVLYTTSVTLLTRKLDEKADKEAKELRAVEEYLGWISLIQFHSLSLQLSARIQDSTSEVDESYLHNAIQLFVQCLRELIKSIRAGISSAKLKEAKKKKEEEAKEKSEKREKGSKKEAEKSESSGKKEVTNENTEVSKKEESGVLESSEALTISELVLDALIREVENASSKRSALNLTNDLGLKEKLAASPGVKGDSLSFKENDIDSLSDAEKEVVTIPNGPSELANGTAESADETPKTKPSEDKFEFSASTLDTTLVLEKEPHPDKSKPSRTDLSDAQMIFGEDNLMRNICALGGLAPINPGHSRWCSPGDSIQEVICREVLPLLLEVVQTACLKNAEKLQLLSVSLLVRFIRRVDPQLVDEVMTTISSSPPLPPSAAPGLSYILFLTNLGTSFLHKHKLIQATTVGHYLQQLLTEHPWMQAYMHNLQKHLDLLPNTAGPVCIFHLLVLAGFPELPAFGMRVEVEQKNSPPLTGLMVQAKEGNSYEVALDNTRSTRNFLEKDVKIKPSTLTIEDKTSLLPILKLTVDCLRIAEKSVEQLYVSFLLQKTILNYVQGDKSGESIHEVLKSGMLDLLAKLACKPTGVDRKWQVAELEHLCIRSYQPDKNRGNTPSPLENEASEETKEKSTEISKAEQRDPLGNLSDSVRETFFNLQGAFTCSLSVIRAAYEKAEKKEETLIENVQRWLTDDKGFQVPEDILEKAKDWEPLEEEPTPEVPEEMDETLDKGLPKYTPISIESKDFAITKDQDKNKKEKEILIPPADTFEGEYATSRKDSLELFYSMENDKLKRSQMKKLLSGLNVLQARHTLFSLILHWNLEVPLCTGFLETMDVSRLFSLLQCAHKSLDESTFDKMLDQLVTHISNTTKKALGVEASKVLGPIKACTIIKESTHPNTKTIVESKIQIKNAIQYIITPDAQSGFQPDDTLLFGSDSQFVENRKEISGTDFKAVNQIVISAKNLHCKVKTPHPNNEWGWKFNVVVVTAGVLSCFDSACKLLERILSKLENSTPLLPLASVWENLFIACCFHPDEERFKIVSLMGLVLKLFTTQNSLRRRTKDPGEVVSKKDPEQQIDLTLLRPLWNYYSKLIDQHDNKKAALMNLKVPPIARMLTDLFTQVELCAGACGMERELMMSQVTDESMDAILRVGIRNVGLVSVAIDADNIIKDKFVQAKFITVDLFKELPFSTNSDSDKKALSLTPAASTEDDSTEDSPFSEDSSSYYSDWSI